MAKRILHIINGLGPGGAERSLVNLLNSSLRERFDHQVLSLVKPEHYSQPLTDMGIAVHHLDFASPSQIPRAILRLRNLVRTTAPHVLQGWMYYGNMAATIARQMMPRPVSVAWNIRHSLDDIKMEKRSTAWLIRALSTLSSGPDAIIYNSHQSREHHEAFGFSSNDGIVIPNGFDTGRWRPDAVRRAAFRRELSIGADNPVLGFIGRFHPQKEIPVFLKACAVAMAADDRLHVVMAGHGLTPDNAALKRYYAQIPAERFHVLGRRNDVEAIMPAFDFLCLSSGYGEAFPNVLGEAMACGLPCIATDVGDTARLMGGHGRILPVGDVAQMASAIGEYARMAPDALRSAGEAARARIASAYSLDSTVKAYASLYNSLTANAKGVTRVKG